MNALQTILKDMVEVYLDILMSFRNFLKRENGALSLLQQKSALVSAMSYPGKNGRRCEAIIKGDVWRYPK